MTIKRLLAICLIVGCTSAAWFLLGGTLQYRSNQTDGRLGSEVVKNWGPLLTQEHPSLLYEAPTRAGAPPEKQPHPLRSETFVRRSRHDFRDGLAEL